MSRYNSGEDFRYHKLDAIDTKCGSLLAVTSILLVFVSLPPIFETVRPAHPFSFKLVFLALIVSCLLSLFVLFFKERTSDRFVAIRKYILNTAVCVTAGACVVVGAVVLDAL